MLSVALACLALIVLVTLTHYEALRLLSVSLPKLRMRSRAKLVVVMLVAFSAHVLEIVLYGLASYGLMRWAGAGTIGTTTEPDLMTALYFSAQNYTSLGYGDVVPHGPLRMIAPLEALHGLLMIGWTASFAYVAMERFWNPRR